MERFRLVFFFCFSEALIKQTWETCSHKNDERMHIARQKHTHTCCDCTANNKWQSRQFSKKQHNLPTFLTQNSDELAKVQLFFLVPSSSAIVIIITVFFFFELHCGLGKCVTFQFICYCFFRKNSEEGEKETHTEAQLKRNRKNRIFQFLHREKQ